MKSTLEMKSTNYNTATFFQETGPLLLWSLVTDVDYQVSDMASSRISLCHWYFFYDSSKSGTMGLNSFQRLTPGALGEVSYIHI